MFVRPLSATAQGRWQVSSGGGYAPQWSHDGRELFFVSGRDMMTARVETRPVFRVLGVQRLFVFPSGVDLTDKTHARYAVTADGHFLMTGSADAASNNTEPHLILIRNWLSEIGPLLKK